MKNYSKKSAFIAVVAAMVVSAISITSCSKDDDGNDTLFSLDKDSVSLMVKQTGSVSSTKTATWMSENDFIASVNSSGEITANHVGKTEIVATADGKSLKCGVTVKANYYTFIEPFHYFTMNKDEVKATALGTLKKETDTKLTFDDVLGNPVVYTFDETTGKLKGVLIQLKISVSRVDEVTDFLRERYEFLSKSGDYYMFIDAMTQDDAKTVVGLKAESYGVSVSYIPAN